MARLVARPPHLGHGAEHRPQRQPCLVDGNSPGPRLPDVVQPETGANLPNDRTYPALVGQAARSYYGLGNFRQPTNGMTATCSAFGRRAWRRRARCLPITGGRKISDPRAPLCALCLCVMMLIRPATLFANPLNPTFSTPTDYPMTTKTAFTADEWSTLLQAPLTASLYISVADPSLFGAFGEVFAVTRQLVEQANAEADNELMGAILAEFKDMASAHAAQPQMESDPAAVKAELLQRLERAVELLNKKATPAEAAGIKQRLLDFAQATANASKEGGFLGISSTGGSAIPRRRRSTSWR